MIDDGQLTEIESQKTKTSELSTASCVCITKKIEPNSIKTLEFALAWHMPTVKFGLGQKIYSKFMMFHLVSKDYRHFFSLGGIQNGLINQQ